MPLYKQFDDMQDPWELLNALRALDMADRLPHLERWLDLVNGRPRAEQDALAAQGKEVFAYQLGTVRDALKQRRAAESADLKVRPTVITDEYLAEMVYNLSVVPSCQYLVHRFDRPDDPPELAEKLKVGKLTYAAPISPLVERDVVLVPSGIEEYGDEVLLFNELEKFVSQYVQLGDRPDKEDDSFRRLLCCYVLLTWVYDRFSAVPYLRTLGDFDSGKSRLLQTVGWLCYRAAAAGGAMSAASLFRMTDGFRGTLIIDEADFDKSEMSDVIIKILNAGYQRDFRIWRAEREHDGGQFNVSVYECYGPKILATRRRFRDAALESRCFTRTMPLVTDLRRDIPLSLGPGFYEQAAKLRNKLLLWRFRWWKTVDPAQEQRIEGVEPRVNQIIQPLLAVGNEQLQSIIMSMVQDYVVQVQEERRRGTEGAVVAALLQHWIRRGRPDDFPMKAVTDGVRTEHGLSKITDRKIGSILDGMNVPKVSRGGITWVKLTEDTAVNLCKRFGLQLRDYELTAGGPVALPRSVLPQPPMAPPAARPSPPPGGGA